MTENQDHTPSVQPVKPPGPHQVAVAVMADKANPDAPAQIIASGRGALASQILEIAFANGIKVREDVGLAEILAQLDLDTPIPSEAIVAVAEILAKVYQANEAMANLATPPESNTTPPETERPL